jgi:putative transposase
MAVSTRAVARWRYEQIAPLLDPALSRADRTRLVEALASSEVRWPSGADRPLSAPTLYRWARLYRKGGFAALEPSPRCDLGRLRAIDAKTVARAMALLRERPGRSLYMLQRLLGVRVPRSTLHRHLRAQPEYAGLRRRAKGESRPLARLHRRFEAGAPHDIWQADAKGPFTVRIGKTRVALHVLTVLDDRSRAVLAAIVARSPNLAAAVRLFRLAAARFGLPWKLYCDRASIFDSLAFRTGLAELGVHRIRTKARRPTARGKIEAYHRSLERWFVGELAHQVVRSVAHLEELLLGTIEVLYQDHRHREIRMTPREALAGCISERRVPLARLEQAFFQVKRVTAHAKTGEVMVEDRPYRLPRALEHLAGSKVTIVYDPVASERAFVEHGRSGQRLALRPRFEPAPEKPRDDERGPGRLQQLLDVYRGRTLPQAEAGTGLPELFELLSSALGRAVPHDDAEADLVHAFYRRAGPFARGPLEAALSLVTARLGPGRPLSTLLAALGRRVAKDQPKEDPS